MMRKLVLLVSGLGVLTAGPAQADLQDYEILRFLYLKTPCGKADLTRLESKGKSLRFRADCENRTAFPDGAYVMCLNVNDDRSCWVENPPREFNNLELLIPASPDGPQ